MPHCWKSHVTAHMIFWTPTLEYLKTRPLSISKLSPFLFLNVSQQERKLIQISAKCITATSKFITNDARLFQSEQNKMILTYKMLLPRSTFTTGCLHYGQLISQYNSIWVLAWLDAWSFFFVIIYFCPTIMIFSAHNE